LRCAAFSAAPPSCHFTAAPRWWPFPGSTCSLALRSHDPLRKPASHACSRGQGWVSMAFEHNGRDRSCQLTHRYTPPRRLAHRSRYPGAQDGVRDFSTRDLRPGPRAFASFRPKRPSLARAPRPSAAPFAARCAPSDRSLHSAAPCLPAHSRVPVTRVRCPEHVCVDRALPQHGERAHQALAVAKGLPRVMARQCERDRARLRTHTARRARRERRTGRDRGHYRVVAGAHVVHSS
jgi:hypothetical protein